MDGAVGKLMMAAHVIDVPVRRDCKDRSIRQGAESRFQTADSHAGIDQQVQVLPAKMPDVGAIPGVDVRFPEKGKSGCHGS